MPNHVTHRVVITGSKEAIDAWQDTCIKQEKDPLIGDAGRVVDCFDFNSITPMPDELHIESGSLAEMGMAYLQDDIEAIKYVRFPEETTEENWKRLIETHHPEAIELGRKALSNIEKYGHADWYHWALDNWGTKWGAYDYDDVAREDICLRFAFQTAWSMPAPILHRMAAMFPTLTIDVVSFDEGWNFAARSHFENGVGEVAYVKPEPGIYKEVYLEDPPKDEDEEEDLGEEEVPEEGE